MICQIDIRPTGKLKKRRNNMQIVIDIDVRAYNKCLKLVDDNDGGILGMHLINAVANGTLLPKNHGRLIDADEVLDKLLEYLVKLETDIPCDYLNGSNYCCETCHYDKPVKECWIKWAEEKERLDEESEG